MDLGGGSTLPSMALIAGIFGRYSVNNFVTGGLGIFSTSQDVLGISVLMVVLTATSSAESPVINELLALPFLYLCLSK